MIVNVTEGRAWAGWYKTYEAEELTVFKDREDAGRELARALKKAEPFEEAVVIAIPRGGVVVGAEVAEALGLPMDVIVPRKIGAPQNPELAVGAITEDGTTIYDERALRLMGLDREALEETVQAQLAEISRRTALYRSGEQALPLQGKTVILVDDGIATGYTTLAALRSIKRAAPSRIILAVPVAPPETVDVMADEVDEVICLLTPEPFFAVGQFYRSFEQTEDDQVIDLLARHHRAHKGRPSPSY